MTEEEAAGIASEIKRGKSFGSRFQEMEWGIEYAGDGRFRQWNVDRAHEDVPTEKFLSEEELVEMLKGHSYKNIRRGLWSGFR